MKVDQKIRQSPMIILLFIVALVGTVISIILSYEDYNSSYLGYIALPTRKANEWVFYAAAAVPQVIQILLAYSYFAESRSPVKLLVFMAAHIADVGTDVYFKAGGQGVGVWVLALAESEFLFTLGSEVLLAFAFNIGVGIFPDFVREAGELFSKIFDALGGKSGGGGGDGGGGKGNNQPQQQNQQRNQQPQHHQQGRQEPGRQVPMPQQVNRSPQDMNRGGGAQSAVQRYQQNQRNNRG